jgi:Mg-chelatase subunit ChlD
MIVLFQPAWLLLLIPLATAWLAWPLPHAGLRLLRAVTFLLVVLAIAGLALKLPDRAGSVVVVADVSESMPDGAAAAQKEIVDLLQKSMGPRDLLGVVAFGREAVVERSPQRGVFGGFTARVGREHSRLNDAIETALNLIPSGEGGRILVLSDGKWTGQDPMSAAARAAGRGIAVDYRLLARPQVSDLALQSFLSPASVSPGEAYVLSAWIQSPVDQEIQYQLRRGPVVLASGSKPIPAGLSRLMFRDRAEQSGLSEYSLAITGADDDPIPQNNQARALVSVEGARPLLVVSPAGEESGLNRLLRAGGLDVVGRSPAECRWTLEELSQYRGVLIENVPAPRIGTTGMETLAAWVEEAGAGLMLTGGQRAYGPGGYFKSPLDRILPVSMEMRREHRKLSLAIVVTLDRSGSMAAPAGAGRTKMDLANIGTVQVLDLLAPTDELGVIAVDSSPHVIVPIDTVEHNQGMRASILGIHSMGGGIFIYEALSAAARMLLDARAETRHIILFADAADSEAPGRYAELLEQCREANITVSVVGLGTAADVDAPLLQDIAARGGGTCYFTDSPEEIPRLFAQDTFSVARSTFVDAASPFQITSGFSLLGAAPPGSPPSLGGYNLCYARPEANLAAVTTDEYTAPVVASWNAGNGRVLCFTGEADGKFSGPLAAWEQVGEFYATLGRWTAGKSQPLPNDLLLTQEVRDGVCIVQLHLDPERDADPFAAPPRIRILQGLPGTTPARESATLQWKTADLLEFTLPMTGRATVLNTVEIPGQTPVTLPPVCLPFSPEFAPDQPGRGASALARIARTAGGRELIEIPDIWSFLPVRPQYVSLMPWLLLAAVLLFLLEIFERRTGWLSRLRRVRRSEPEAPVSAGLAGDATAASRTASRGGRAWFARKARTPPAAGATPPASVSPATAASPAPETSAPADPLDTFRQARDRASRRTGKPTAPD